MKYFISRRDSIILSAIEIINELGIQGLSTKELAARQKVNESALYRHFKNKDDIIDGVLQYFSLFEKAISSTSLESGAGCRDRIYDYLKSYLEYFESYPEISSILFLSENLCRQSDAWGKAVGILDSGARYLSGLIADGQKNNEIDSSFTPQELAQTLLGYCNTVIIDWRRAGFSYSFKTDATGTVEKLLALAKGNPQ